MAYISIVDYGGVKASFPKGDRGRFGTANIGYNPDHRFNLGVNVSLVDPMPARDGKELLLGFSKAFIDSGELDLVEVFRDLSYFETMMGSEEFLKASAVMGRLAKEVLTIDKPQEVYIYASATDATNRLMEGVAYAIRGLGYDMRSVDSFYGQTLWVGCLEE